jgi:5-methylcytosine-specific restriction endonuclease McrA
MARKPRDYDKEYREYQGTPEQLRNQSLRHKARRKLQKEGLVKPNDGKEVDHKTSLKDGGSPLRRSNLQVLSRTANRKKGA